MSAQRVTPRRADGHPASHPSTSRNPSASQTQSKKGSTPSSGVSKQTKQTSNKVTQRAAPSANRKKPSTKAAKTKARVFSPKRIALGVLVVILAVAALGLVVDVTSNYGKIHKGVVLQGINLGGMTREEAASTLDQQIGAALTSDSVDLFADAQAMENGADDQTVDLSHASTTYQASQDIENATSWQISAATVGATFDSAQLAQKAYDVGRGLDFFAGRWKATFKGVELPAELTYEPAQLTALEGLLNDALGKDMQNADISFADGTFSVVSGEAGSGVDHNAFIAILDQAFMGASRGLVIPLGIIPVDITDTQAAAVAQVAQDAISQPVSLVYGNEDSWDLDSDSLGSWIATSVEGQGAEAKLIPQVSAKLLQDGISGIIGDRDPGIQPQDASFQVQDGGIVVVPSVDGTGINYTQVATDLNGILFPTGDAVKDRQVQMTVTTLKPSLTTQAAQDMHITDMIATYTTEYPYSSDAKITNIHLAADLINDSLIEPGGVWSFNDTTGNCTADRGFQEAKSIVDGDYVDEIGGGICQVATTVFNAVLESGMPVVERVNHSYYLIAYPAGRDATVSWKWPDLQFENGTDNWMLLTMSYTDESVTCTLWGTDPGYSVEFTDTGFTDRTDFEIKKTDDPDLPKGEENITQEGVKGRTIVVTRSVYDSQGNLIDKTDFKSVYDPEPELVEVGTKDVPTTTDTSTDTSGGTTGTGAATDTGGSDATGSTGDTGGTGGTTDTGSPGVSGDLTGSVGSP